MEDEYTGVPLRSTLGTCARRGNIQEGEKLLRIAREAGKTAKHIAIGIENGVEGDGDGSEGLLFEFLIESGGVVGSVGIKVHENEALHGRADFGPREHIGLHPVTIRAS